eukprot:6462945-Prymnesium_polylepis.1
MERAQVNPTTNGNARLPPGRVFAGYECEPRNSFVDLRLTRLFFRGPGLWANSCVDCPACPCTPSVPVRADQEQRRREDGRGRRE